MIATAGVTACSWTFGSSRYAQLVANPDLNCIRTEVGAIPDVRVAATWTRSGDALMLAPKLFANSFGYSLRYEARDGFWGQISVEFIDDDATEFYIHQKFPVQNATSRRKLTCTQEDHDYASRLMDEIYERAKSACDLQVHERRQSQTVHKSNRCPPRNG
jgi:hypothetical protein